jgi:hypothetical protein
VNRRNASAFGSGAIVGILGGLIGLGGAEFRLPVLLGVFRFRPLDAVILNKAMSLIVVAAALIFRSRAVPLSQVGAHWSVVVDLLGGSLFGAWCGAGWATRMRSETLFRVIAVLLIGIAFAMTLGHDDAGAAMLATPTTAVYVCGVVAGFGIGVVASLMGVAGGEFIIPTLIVLFGADAKLAGSLSLAISLPTMITGFVRYSRDRSFIVLAANSTFVMFMAVGSIAGASVGGLLLGVIPADVLLPGLAIILAISAVRIWRHTGRQESLSATAEGAFAFEPEDVRRLTYIPLRFRMKLDVCGIHLTQRQWSQLPRPVRKKLTEAPYKTDEEAARLRNSVAAAVREAGGGDVRVIATPHLPWRSSDVPDEVLRGLSWADLPTIDSKAWDRMSEDRRFALVKLTRKGHSKNLEAALREFGLLERHA